MEPSKEAHLRAEAAEERERQPAAVDELKLAHGVAGPLEADHVGKIVHSAAHRHEHLGLQAQRVIHGEARRAAGSAGVLQEAPHGRNDRVQQCGWERQSCRSETRIAAPTLLGDRSGFVSMLHIAHMHSLALFFVGGLWRRAGQLSTMVRTWLCAALPFVPCRPHLPRRLADGRVVRQPR